MSLDKNLENACTNARVEAGGGGGGGGGGGELKSTCRNLQYPNLLLVKIASHAWIECRGYSFIALCTRCMPIMGMQCIQSV